MSGSLHLHKVALAATEKVLASAQSAPIYTREQQIEVASLKLVLGNLLSNSGKREESLKITYEAQEIYRLLAQEGITDILPDFATSLNNLSVRFMAIGQIPNAFMAAQESLEIWRDISGTGRSHRKGLARTLENLSAVLREQGKRDEALAANQEAVKIYQELEQIYGGFLPELASGFHNLAVSLRDLNRIDEALHATIRAVEIRGFLAEHRPDIFLLEFAMSLSNFGAALGELGRDVEALAPLQEALEIRRRLYLRNPDAVGPDLARSLHNLSRALRLSGNYRDALTKSDEAIRTLQPFLLLFPEAFFDPMKEILANHFKICEHLGQEPEEKLLHPILVFMASYPV